MATRVIDLDMIDNFASLTDSAGGVIAKNVSLTYDAALTPDQVVQALRNLADRFLERQFVVAEVVPTIPGGGDGR